MNPLLSQTSRLTVGRHSNLMQCVHKLSKRNYLMPRMAVRSGNPQPLHITKNTFNCKQYQISTRGLATIHSNLGSTPTDIGSRPRATQKFLDKASAEIQSTMGFDTSSDSNEFQNTPTMSTQSTLSDSQTRKHAHMGPPGSVNDDAIDWGARTSPLNSGSGFGPNAKHIDTLTLSQKLNTSGFKPEQSEQIVRILMDVIRESHHSWGAHVAMNRDLEDFKHRQAIMNETLKHKIDALDKTRITLLSFDVDKNQSNIKELRSEFKDEIEILKGHIRLDFNLEKGRNREVISQIDDRISVMHGDFQRLSEKTQSNIATEMERLKTQIEQGKLDAFKFFVGALMTSVSVSLAFYRFVIV